MSEMYFAVIGHFSLNANLLLAILDQNLNFIDIIVEEK